MHQQLTALATARTIHGVSFDGSANIDLTEVVQDTVGAMFSSNTETGIAVTYQDGDGTIDLAVSGAKLLQSSQTSMKQFKMWLVQWYHPTPKVVSQSPMRTQMVL